MGNLQLYIPDIDDLWFKEKMLIDEKTMAYNHDYGGTISFKRDKWKDWYDKWIQYATKERFYRYLKVEETGEFIGEVAYHLLENRYFLDILIYYHYRRKGYGQEGLELLIQSAKENGIEIIYDELAIDNSAIDLFLKNGFTIEKKNFKTVTIYKKL